MKYYKCRKRSHRRAPGAGLLLFLVSSFVGVAPTIAEIEIVVGEHVLLPDTDGQTIAIHVTGAEDVQGLNFNVQIGDGGQGEPEPTPKLAGVDIVGPETIFAPSNTGQRDLVSQDQIAVAVTTTESGSVPAQGVLAVVTIDTSGIMSGEWSLALEATMNGPTDFAGTPATIQDGSIRIPSLLADWYTRHFTAAERGNPLIGGLTADPDFDGLSNLLELGIATNPRVADVTPDRLPVLELVEDGGEQYWEISYTERVDDYGLDYVSELSTDLATWVSTGDFPVPFGVPEVLPDGEVQRVTLRSILPADLPVDRLFLRVGVRLQGSH